MEELAGDRYKIFVHVLLPLELLREPKDDHRRTQRKAMNNHNPY